MSELIDRLPPHDIGAEMAMIGSMMTAPKDIIDAMRSTVPSADFFYKDAHAWLYKTICALHDTGSPMDALLVHSELNRKALLENAGGYDYLGEVLLTVPSWAHGEYYAKIVREKSLMRKIITCGNTILQSGYSTTTAAQAVEEAERLVMALASDKAKQGTASTIGESLQAALDAMDKGSQGILTGIKELDDLTTGLHDGELVIVAARPSVGKTAFMMGLMERQGVDERKPVGIFSMEMRKEELAQRMLCSRARVDSQKLRRNMLNIEERTMLSGSCGDINEAPIHIDDTPNLSVMELRSRARRMKSEFGVTMLGIDYLQLMDGGGSRTPRHEQVSEISRGVKSIARELCIPVVALCQLNRSSETEGRMPRCSDLRESGSLEQDADVVILLHNESVAKRGDQEWFEQNPDKLNIASAILAKQRNGPCDTVKMTFLQKFGVFMNYCPEGV